jgi:Domain of unknown function (DUF4389)
MSITPVNFEADYVERRSRLTTFFRLILAIPHLFFAAIWGFATYFVVIAAWFALVITGRWPRGLYDFSAGYLRYITYLYGYVGLLTDEYPPFNGSADAEYPVRLNIGEPKPHYDRLKVALRIFLLIPVAIVMFVMAIVWQIGTFVAWFAIVILGKQPRGLQEMIELGMSYQQRGSTYALLVDEQFPSFAGPQPALGPGPDSSLPAASDSGAQRLSP